MVAKVKKKLLSALKDIYRVIDKDLLALWRFWTRDCHNPLSLVMVDGAEASCSQNISKADACIKLPCSVSSNALKCYAKTALSIRL